MPPTMDLARREGVELFAAGDWPALTGRWQPTAEDVAAAVEAQHCPAIRKPVIKLGHQDRRFDGEPALGWYENLRASADGSMCVGDQMALPWLNQVQAAAYPSRSIEGVHNYACAAGHKHKFVLTAVALLGVTPPAVSTIKNLNDLQSMLGVAASEPDLPEGAERIQATVMAAAEVHTGAMVALIPTAEDAARLAVDGGEPAEQLHVTLAYLGEAADLGDAGQQDVIDAVSSAANGLPVIEAEAFSPALFNPGSANDRDPCAVLLLSGEWLDIVHTLIAGALYDMPIPDQHRPWIPHLTARYADGTETIEALAEKVGPVRFDRLRVAFAGQALDIPLIGGVDPADPVDESEMVAAASADRKSLKAWWLHGPGLKKWKSWTDLYKHLRTKVNPAFAKRIASEWFHERYGYWPGDKRNRDKVAAAEAPPTTESHTPTPPDPGGVSVSPAAEPDLPPEEDLVSLDPDVRQRLGLADDADMPAALAAIDALKAKADTPAEPSPEAVAASAADAERRAELEKEVTTLSARMAEVTAELAATKAERAATVKASVLDAAVKDGKIKPADRAQWETDYDEAPGVTTRVLASIAPGTAVPVMASGVTGPAEPEIPGDLDTEYERFFGADATKGA